MRKKKGKALNYPVSVERRYSRELKRWVREMTKDSRDAVLSLFDDTSKKKDFAQEGGIAQAAQAILTAKKVQWSSYFDAIAREKVNELINRILRESGASCKSSLKPLFEDVTISLENMTPAMKEIFQASVNQGVDLIKSIPPQYFDRISGDVMRTITTPTSSLKELSRNLSKYGEMSYRRANNIALDQTRKAYQSFNRQMIADSGIKKAIWLHSGGSFHPRHKHKAFDGKEFDLSKGAPVGDDGGYVFPAQEPYCRCTFIPVISFS